MLTIFDIDGTVCDTQDVEGRCFSSALEDVCGRTLETVDWTRYEEPTSSGIARSLLATEPDPAVAERRLEKRFVELLREAQPHFPADFSPLPGAVPWIERLVSESNITVAFATGGFASEAAFKLRCCDIDLTSFPHATSSDSPRRREIIPLAAQRAGVSLDRAIYFGDAPWDVQACAALHLPMIGIGRRIEQLDVEHAFRDFSDSEAIEEALRQISRDWR